MLPLDALLFGVPGSDGSNEGSRSDGPNLQEVFPLIDRLDICCEIKLIDVEHAVAAAMLENHMDLLANYMDLSDFAARDSSSDSSSSSSDSDSSGSSSGGSSGSSSNGSSGSSTSSSSDSSNAQKKSKKSTKGKKKSPSSHNADPGSAQVGGGRSSESSGLAILSPTPKRELGSYRCETIHEEPPWARTTAEFAGPCGDCDIKTWLQGVGVAHHLKHKGLEMMAFDERRKALYCMFAVGNGGIKTLLHEMTALPLSARERIQRLYLSRANFNDIGAQAILDTLFDEENFADAPLPKLQLLAVDGNAGIGKEMLNRLHEAVERVGIEITSDLQFGADIPKAILDRHNEFSMPLAR